MGYTRGQIRRMAIRKVLMRAYYQGKLEGMTCGQLAHAMGMKSSTYLKRVVASMEREDICISISKPTEEWRVWWEPLEQMPLPDRYITINGKAHRVADWVGVK